MEVMEGRNCSEEIVTMGRLALQKVGTNDPLIVRTIRCFSVAELWSTVIPTVSL